MTKTVADFHKAWQRGEKIPDADIVFAVRYWIYLAHTLPNQSLLRERANREALLLIDLAEIRNLKYNQGIDMQITDLGATGNTLNAGVRFSKEDFAMLIKQNLVASGTIEPSSNVIVDDATFQVPGGGDYSNMALDIHDHDINVKYRVVSA